MTTLDKMIGFLTTTKPEEAKTFFSGVLGFALKSEDGFALVFDANGTMLRVVKGREFKPTHGTVLGWEVDDVHKAVEDLTARGVKFEQFNLDFLKQDEAGVWTTPNGDQVAWFRDPDGSVLSISSHKH